MAIPSRGIGWSTEDNLLWQISKQLERLTQVTGNSVSGSQTLAQTLVIGNNTGGTDILLNSTDAIQLENNSSLRKGTYDFGQGGGVSRICGVDYEDMWQGGIRHVFDSNGFIRNSSNCFNIIPNSSFDDTLRFKIGSFWTLDDGTTYICTDATTGAAVWELFSAPPKYKVYTALLTQNGGDDQITVYAGETFEVGVTYLINAIAPGVDLIPFGAPNNDYGTYFVCTTGGIVPSSPLVTVQLIKNNGAPVVTVLENTIGNVWFIYNNTGVYNVNSNGLFIGNKTYLTIELYFGILDSQGTFRNSFYYDGDSSLRINTQSTGDGYTWTFINDMLLNTPIEIRVYS
jgi:hypothetical protein